ncbi:hypothetical protein AB0A74_01140 [Saccharothrix sp. NPDC042600]|uniref:hypothetical protein n=1 Tax=Saccharothrix TaxID=2071 RepID=UPI0033F0EEFA|nr:hypothetical protein GCM10017745_49320 [Saccharothrix mutabilis subsp. capreolus]
MNKSTSRHRILAAPLVLLACLAGAGTALAAQPSAPPPPQALRITMSDGITETSAGERIPYTLSISNGSGDPATGLAVGFTLPRGVSAAEISAAGTVTGSQVDWTLDVPAHHSVDLTLVGVVDTIPEGMNGIAVSACVAAGPRQPPLVCTSDINQVRGAPSIQGLTAAPAAESKSWTPSWWQIGLAVAALLLVVLAVVVLVHRRRKAERGTRHRASTVDRRARDREKVGT